MTNEVSALNLALDIDDIVCIVTKMPLDDLSKALKYVLSQLEDERASLIWRLNAAGAAQTIGARRELSANDRRDAAGRVGGILLGSLDDQLRYALRRTLVGLTSIHEHSRTGVDSELSGPYELFDLDDQAFRFAVSDQYLDSDVAPPVLLAILELVLRLVPGSKVEIDRPQDKISGCWHLDARLGDTWVTVLFKNGDKLGIVANHECGIFDAHGDEVYDVGLIKDTTKRIVELLKTKTATKDPHSL